MGILDRMKEGYRRKKGNFRRRATLKKAADIIIDILVEEGEEDGEEKE